MHVFLIHGCRVISNFYLYVCLYPSYVAMHHPFMSIHTDSTVKVVMLVSFHISGGSRGTCFLGFWKLVSLPIRPDMSLAILSEAGMITASYEQGNWLG